MEVGEVCFIISLPFNAISWSSLSAFGNLTDFRIHVSPIQESVSCNMSGDDESIPFYVSLLNENGSTFVDQPSKGIQYSNEYFMFKSVTKIKISGIRFEFFFKDENNPKLSSFVMFEDKSPGLASSPIVDNKLSVVGTIKVGYLIVKPYPFPLDQTSSPEFNNFLKKGLHVGHRGAGVDRRIDLSDNILENTILSLNHAFNHGADMVEFDVILSKDNIPILYHDYSVYASLAKKGSNDTEKFELPVKDLTYQQLQTLKLGPVRENNRKPFEFNLEDSGDKQPFPTLEHALKTVVQGAFNIEVKYETGSGIYKDLNNFVDTILKTVFDHHNNRDIIFSSFDPDVCAMIHLKQNKFPVLFLTEDSELTTEIDHRTISVKMASYYSLAMNFSGVDCDASSLIADKSLIKYVTTKGLLLFCYGDAINSTEIIQQLIDLGVHGVIYDKIDIISPKKLLTTTTVTPQAGDTN